MVKTAAGFFTVLADGGNKYLCQARGNLKRGREVLIVGDLVSFQPEESSLSARLPRGLIEKRFPRQNRLQRPLVANVDQLVVVASTTEPATDWQLINRLGVLAEKESLQIVVCINKTDLVSAQAQQDICSLTALYPYPFVFTSAKTLSGIKDLQAHLRGLCSVLAGPSGAGKSSLINALRPAPALKTGGVSEKIGRGRHTTRHCELLSLAGGGSVVDTPGFTRLGLQDIKPAELAALFPEFEQLRAHCAFRDCRHLKEPGCAVKEALGTKISPMRYEHYSLFAAEIDGL